MAKNNENKTKPLSDPPEDFLKKVSAKRQEEAKILMEMMSRLTGEEACMWGESIIGFGSVHYAYESGREGDMPLLGFSPRKASLTVYFSEGFDAYAQELEKLGKHKTSVSCLYINKLEDVDLKILEKMLKKSIKFYAKKIESVEEYLAHVPPQAEKQFRKLRKMVKELLPESMEVLSYGILGYKADKKRARVFISAFKDHVAIYPVPKDPQLEDELTPYRKGKGTLWFSLEGDLPKELIKRTVLALWG